MSQRQLRDVRGRRIALVSQDPATSLHPMLTIGTQLTEHLRHHLGLGKAAARARAVELLGTVRIPDPERALGLHPGVFSGGMRQRIAIASALACEPDVLLADEPTTALDVTVQAGILRLLDRLRRERGLAVLIITHDLGVLSAIADDICVMYGGAIVERGRRAELLSQPQHPYTRALLDALPHPELPGSSLQPIPGRPPTLGELPPGCPFEPRCGYRVDACAQHRPELVEAAPGHAGGLPDHHLGRCGVTELPMTELPGHLLAPGRTAPPAAELLIAEGLSVEYGPRRHRVRAVDRVNLAVQCRRGGRPGRRVRLRQVLPRPGAGRPGAGRLRPRDASPATRCVPLGQARRPERLRPLQMVFQDPYASLNPRRRVGDLIADGVTLRGGSRAEGGPAGRRAARSGRAAGRRRDQVPARVQRRPAPADRHRPHAWPPGPRCIVADEPISALDASAQAQVANLLLSLAREDGLGVVFISHDLSIVRQIADRVAVMYLGRIVETGDTGAGLVDTGSPLHRGPGLGDSRGPTAPAGCRSTCPVTCPTRPGRRRAAGSTPGARWPRRAASRSTRRCARYPPDLPAGTTGLPAGTTSLPVGTTSLPAGTTGPSMPRRASSASRPDQRGSRRVAA